MSLLSNKDYWSPYNQLSFGDGWVENVTVALFLCLFLGWIVAPALFFRHNRKDKTQQVQRVALHSLPASGPNPDSNY
jgi:hypothetical protein